MFSFEPFQIQHLAPLRNWLNADHIKDVWQETDDDERLKEKFLNELPNRGVFPFVVVKNLIPIAYVQYYDALKVGGGWWENEVEDTFGIDIMIGAPECLGRGLGPIIIKEFIELLQKSNPTVKSVIIDPAPSNERAIRAFIKAGFQREAEITTPGGRAVLLRMKLCE